MDGLMLDTESIVKEAIQLAGDELGLRFSDPLCFQMIGLNAHSVRLFLQETFGNDFPLQEFYQHVRRHSMRITDQRGIAKKTGLMELLHWLEAIALPKALGTSSSRESALEKLQKAQILNHFPIMVCGDEVQKGKPAPDIFLKAATQLQVAPQDCVVLEDSEAGIRAASAAGMWPIMVPDLQAPSPQMERLAYEIFPSLHEVKAHLAEKIHWAVRELSPSS